MFPILFQSFWLPLREIKSIIKIFWPLVVIYILFLLVFNFLFPFPVIQETGGSGQLKFSTDGFALRFLILFVFAIYFALISYGGIIKWHRKLILNEDATSLRLAPGWRELKYLGYSLLFGLAFALIGLFSLWFFFNVSGFAKVDPQTLRTFSFINKMILYNFLIVFVITAIFLLLLGKHLLRLPNVAVEGGPLDLSNMFSDEKMTWILLVLASTMIIMLMNYGVFLMYYGVVNLENLQSPEQRIKMAFSPLNLFFTALNMFLAAYSALAYASLLSVFYRERI